MQVLPSLVKMDVQIVHQVLLFELADQKTIPIVSKGPSLSKCLLNGSDRTSIQNASCTFALLDQYFRLEHDKFHQPIDVHAFLPMHLTITFKIKRAESCPQFNVCLLLLDDRFNHCSTFICMLNSK